MKALWKTANTFINEKVSKNTDKTTTVSSHCLFGKKNSAVSLHETMLNSIILL